MRDRTKRYIGLFERYHGELGRLNSSVYFMWTLNLFAVLAATLVSVFAINNIWVWSVPIFLLFSIAENRIEQWVVIRKASDDWNEIHESGYPDSIEGYEKEQLGLAIGFYAFYLDRRKTAVQRR